MSRHVYENYVSIAKVKAGNRKDLINKAIALMGSEDSNGNNGAEYLPDEILEYFHLKNYMEADKINKTLPKKERYTIDRYVREQAMGMIDKSDKEILDYLFDYYVSHWDNEAVMSINYTTNNKKQIDSIAVALA